jgi:hypothetical protein
MSRDVEARVSARSQLADLLNAIDVLAEQGVDVAPLRTNASRIAAEIEASAGKQLIEGWLRSQPEGQVIAYRAQFPHNPTIYSFAAIKIGLEWYTTSKSGPGVHSSRDLAAWMVRVNLVSCVRLREANHRDAYRSPDVEMGPR